MRITNLLAAILLVLGTSVSGQQGGPAANAQAGPQVKSGSANAQAGPLVKSGSAPAKDAKQKSKAKKKSGAEAEDGNVVNPWLERAKLLTQEVLDQDRPALKEAEVPVLNIQLARLWWKQDPVRAREWLNAAVEAVEHVPQNEKEEERDARIQNGSALVETAMELRQQELAYRASAVVEKEIASQTDRGSLQRNTAALSRALVNGQMRSGSRDAQEVLTIGRELVRVGDPYALGQVETTLRSEDPASADQLILEALQEALSADNPRMLYFAVGAASPVRFGQARIPDEKVTAQVWQSAVSAVQQASASPEKLQGYCPVAAELDHLQKSLAPQQLAILEQVLRKCPHHPTDSAFPKEGDQPEDLLARAGEDASSKVSARAKINAAMLASGRQHDPERAMEVLNGLSDEEKKAAPDWTNGWWDAAFMMLRKYVAEGRRAEIDELAQHAPAERKTAFLLAYAQMLERSGQPNSALPILIEARKSLQESEDGAAAIDLFGAYARLFPTEAGAVLREAVTAINNQKPCDEERRVPCRYQLGDRIEPAPLATQVVDIDPGLVDAAISDIQKPKARASLRLGVVRAALQRYDFGQHTASVGRQ